MFNCFCDAVRTLKDILRVLKDIRALLRLQSPGLVSYKYMEIDGMQTGVVLTLPPSVNDDVTNGGSRSLGLTLNGNPLAVAPLAGDAVESEFIPCVDGDVLAGTLSDVDKKGNVSPAREFSFIVTDNVAPLQPGEVGIMFQERPDAPPAE
jgi:hypothetical protein